MLRELGVYSYPLSRHNFLYLNQVRRVRVDKKQRFLKLDLQKITNVPGDFKKYRIKGFCETTRRNMKKKASYVPIICKNILQRKKIW